MKLPGIWLLPVLLLGACTDEAEQIPAYLHIEPFEVDALGGKDWQQITEGWVYVDNEFLGAYTLPADVPVLAEGQNDILVFPGVKENGLQQTPGVYPFLERYETKTNLTPAQTTSITPVTRYGTPVVFPWAIERTTFNFSGIVLENRDADTATTYVLTTAGAFEGQSVKMEVNTDHPSIEIVTEVVENLPSTGAQPVWLELNYRNDMPFELWLLGTQGSIPNELPQPVFQFVPSENWNKIYINLTEFLVAMQQDKYRLYFRVNLPKDLNGNYVQDSGTVFLDNLRLMHF